MVVLTEGTRVIVLYNIESNVNELPKNNYILMKLPLCTSY